MDGNEIPYTHRFAKLAKSDESEIVAVISSSTGEEFPVNEKDLLEAYEDHIARNAALPVDDREYDLALVAQEARAAIQDYKIRHNIPLDTPRTVNPFKPANDELYGADVHTLDL